jgi:transposase
VTYFVGLDVSLEETAICVVDNAGEMHVAIERLGLEAGLLSPWLSQSLQAARLSAVCSETRRMKGATATMAVKTDRNDAGAIAQPTRVGWFTALHLKPRR